MESTASKPPVLVNYSQPGAPVEYQCSQCGALNCKLWRGYQSFTVELLCARCAAKDQDKSIDDIDFDGRRTELFPSNKTPEIGWLVPAVPAENQPDVYWGYGAIPKAGWNWWKRLTTLPAI